MSAADQLQPRKIGAGSALAIERAKMANPGLLLELSFIERFLHLEFYDHRTEEEKGPLDAFCHALPAAQRTADGQRVRRYDTLRLQSLACR